MKKKKNGITSGHQPSNCLDPTLGSIQLFKQSKLGNVALCFWNLKYSVCLHGMSYTPLSFFLCKEGQNEAMAFRWVTAVLHYFVPPHFELLHRGLKPITGSGQTLIPIIWKITVAVTWKLNGSSQPLQCFCFLWLLSQLNTIDFSLATAGRSAELSERGLGIDFSDVCYICEGCVSH